MIKSISLSSKTKHEILKFIENEELQADEILPSENTFMDILGVSRYTVREALALLEQDKIIYKIKGKGTFINKRPIQIESGLEKLESITEIIQSFGYQPGTTWVGVEEGYPTKDMVKKLRLEANDKIITLKRIRTANGKAAAYLVDTIPKKLVNNESLDNIDSESVFSYIKEKFGIVMDYATTEIIPTLPTEEMIERLKVPKNKLFILLHQLHYDKEGHPILYSFDYFDSEIFKLKVNRIT
ncbi:GntR family transcriptional regulator [Tissierella sp.]|uniref:GntR family transcriptional regulator n=1 Tax=Tissierella sp. TaxID=41274 RepID=UPI0028594917|nr:GntR family transcriptional regulator [Tissierella sp.]MDR7856797.1 GntR family transcriptional regulator [Tissierella sp.]